MGNLNHPVVDRTGLAGNFDFILEWVPRTDNTSPVDQPITPDLSGPTFKEALKEQLGLKLVKATGTTEVYVLDHVEHPTPN